MTAAAFKKTILSYYRRHGRHDLPWRKTTDPYKILVSEIMLQQTQVPRVIPKYRSFLKKFPNVRALARASLADVLSEWQGLGYNRRGLYLKRCAEQVVARFNGVFPADQTALKSLPGIGPATAADLLAFAWNIPVPAIETNIRSVFLHFFFADQSGVSDAELMPLIEKTLDRKNPREWYWALFDYGAFLKTKTNPNIRSRHYTKQSPFKGSNREQRSRILKLILEKPRTVAGLTRLLPTAENIDRNVKDMIKEGLLRQQNNRLFIV